MLREFSAGGIIFNQKGHVLLIHNLAMKDPKKSYWGFPKGHLNHGESSREAALREVQEETGLEVEIINKVGEDKYVFTSKEGKVFKVVTFYLMETKSLKISIQEEELLGAQWFDPEEALTIISFPSGRALLKKALEMRNG